MFGNVISTLIILIVMSVLILGGIYMGIAGKYLYDNHVGIIDDKYSDLLKTAYILIFLGTALLGGALLCTMAIPVAMMFKGDVFFKILTWAEGLTYLVACGAYSVAAIFAFKARSDKAEFDDLWRKLNTLGIFSIIFALLALMVGAYAISYKRTEAEDEKD